MDPPRWGSRDRALGYLTSRKHLAGTAGGLVGVGLTLGGITGPLWPAVVGGLYAAGALLAPPERSPTDVVRALLHASATEAAELREDLGQVARQVRSAREQLPEGAFERFEHLEGKLIDMLGHPNALADPEVLHLLSTTIRKDLDQIVTGYLALPVHLRERELTDLGRTPERELVHQLGLLDDYVTGTSEHVFRSHTQDIVNLSDYLEDRNHPDGDVAMD